MQLFFYYKLVTPYSYSFPVQNFGCPHFKLPQLACPSPPGPPVGGVPVVDLSWLYLCGCVSIIEIAADSSWESAGLALGF